MDDRKMIYNDADIQQEIKEIYLQYHNSIKIFIGQLEVLQNKFPVEILNEIRAVFSHIAKVYAFDNEEIARHNIEKAKSHIKRAQLDAFKYMCYAYSKFYKEFRDLYKNVDLSYVNNGEFIVELSNTYAAALKKAEEARIVEAKADNGIEAYEVYEESYYEYAKLYKLIIDNLPIMEKLQQKEMLQREEVNGKLDSLQASNAELQEKLSALQAENEQEKKKNKIITCISIALGVASVVLGIMAFI